MGFWNELVFTALGHAATGFVTGFLAAMATAQTAPVGQAVLFSAFWGFIGAGKAFLDYIEKNGPTTPGGIRVNGTEAKELRRYFV